MSNHMKSSGQKVTTQDVACGPGNHSGGKNGHTCEEPLLYRLWKKKKEKKKAAPFLFLVGNKN